MSVQSSLFDGRQWHGGENTSLCSGHSSHNAVYSIGLSTIAMSLSAGSTMFARTDSSGHSDNMHVRVKVNVNKVGVC